MTTKPLNKIWIAAHIPHQGSMCLLDQVSQWDTQSITCLATSHRLPSNPLRNGEQLNTACGIEYAAQAMAVHGALLAPTNQPPPRAGFLISVRGSTVYRARLDDLKQALTITAKCISRNDDSILYSFTLHAKDTLLLAGRAAVMTNIDSLLGNST